MKSSIVNANLENEKEQIIRKMNAIENQIDDLVCELYDLTINDKKNNSHVSSTKELIASIAWCGR
jgi:septation ring formation regulator EzrA